MTIRARVVVASVIHTRRVQALASAFVLASLPLIVHCGQETPESSAGVGRGTPVILISVDTLRSDRLPMYGYDGIETPALDRLRGDSILFEHAYAPAPLTLPSHSSILTGTDPDRHGVRSNVGYLFPSDIESLPSLLEAADYATGAVVSAWVLRHETGIGEHFDFYDDQVGSATGISFASVQRAGNESASIAAEWVEGRGGSPFFLMLHLFEPHTPYEPPTHLEGRYVDPYDGEIVATDVIVGEFLDRLRKAGLYDDSLIVFLSDHGEGLGDHGEPGHGIFLYREAIQVPLMIKLPGSARRGESVSAPVSLIDVAPTILRVLGLPVPGTMQGTDILATFAQDRPLYSETLYPRLHLGWSELRSIVRGPDHFIEAPQPELYDLRDDPSETKNLLSERRRVYAALRDHLADRSLALADPSTVDPEEAAKLAALGYLGSTASTGDEALPDPKERIGEIQQLIEAMNLAATGDGERAIEAFRSLLSANPKLVEGWLQLGRLLDEKGRWDESLEAYRNAMKLAPTGSGETALSIAEILLRLERFDEAEEHVALGDSVNPARAGVIRARIALSQGELDAAEKEARSVPPGVQKDQADVLLARILVESGRLNEAMRVVEDVGRRAAERREPPPEGLLFVRGDIMARSERLDEAIASFEKEIELYPHNLQAYANLAVVTLLRGDQSRIRDIMYRMVQANQSDRARRFAAHTLRQLGDDSGATLYQ